MRYSTLCGAGLLLFGLCVGPLFAQTAAAPTPAQVEAARVARLRLLCVQVSGGDLTQLDGQLKFQRCMKDPPRQAMLQNTLGVKNAPTQPQPLVTGPMPQLVTPQGPLIHPAQLNTTAAQPASPAGDRCVPGYVWREAAPQDHVCVTPVMHRLTAQDNAAAGRRAEPNAKACRAGFVWREAFKDDLVCVTPAARAQAAADNAQAPSRLAPH